MSLLMDALKRAETSKQEAARAAAGHEVPAQAVGALSLEPLTTPPGTSGSLPDLAAHIDALDADLAATAPPPRRTAPATPQPALTPQPPPPSVEEFNQATARNAFAAKQPGTPSRRPMWLALGTLGVAMVGIGAYVLYQTQSLGSGSLTSPAGGPAAVAQRPVPPAAPLPALPLTPPVAPRNLAHISPSTAAAAPAPPAASRPALSSRAESAATLTPGEGRSAAPAIRLTRSRPEPDANVEAGYASLQGNQVDTARRDYERALKADPNNVDALLALAAIAQRQGRSTDADRYRQRAIDADPRDAAAQAASLGGSASGDPLANESRLKTLLASQPESGPLNFALGNLYSRQNRWSEAQQVYFNAVATDADNPDYLFNLAVSLDHLRQPKLAAQHYRLALEAAQRRPAAFDRDRVTVRLAEIQP
jgi:tetratricopeptide (TPR) repeat protein